MVGSGKSLGGQPTGQLGLEGGVDQAAGEDFAFGLDHRLDGQRPLGGPGRISAGFWTSAS